MPYHRLEEHTSELQSLTNLVCRLLLEKKKKKKKDRRVKGHENEGGEAAGASTSSVSAGLPHIACLVSMISTSISFIFFFFFNDTATTEIYTLSLHDALPILVRSSGRWVMRCRMVRRRRIRSSRRWRSEEHTSELQSLAYLVCRLLLEKKTNKHQTRHQKNDPTTNNKTPLLVVY